MRTYAKKVINYIFLAHSFRSPYESYNKSDKEYNARESAGLSQTWEPEAIDKRAIAKYFIVHFVF